MRRGERDLEPAELHRLPFVELVHNREAEPVDQIADTMRHNDRLIGCDASQGAAVEVIEVRMGHENEIDRRQVMNLKSGPLEPLDHLEPLRPVRVD